MSLGRQENGEIRETPVESIRFVAARSAKAFFEHPAKILFYTGMAGLLIGLFCGLELPFQYYLAVGVLGIIALASHVIQQEHGSRE